MSNKSSKKAGTPYTVSEARLAAEQNVMDQYHKELILFLCDRVDELEKLLSR